MDIKILDAFENLVRKKTNDQIAIMQRKTELAIRIKYVYHNLSDAFLNKKKKKIIYCGLLHALVLLKMQKKERK